ncbi:ATP-binding protein [Alteromonadaceae bacterium BrNp21-10]|nr:ATP-binding protein [Alteromonadaceae bacterium BrNp21-10]
MKSIRNKLVRTLSYTITGVIVLILLAIDVSVDTWIDGEFNKAMHAKAGMLMTLVSEDNEGVELHFSGEFMPEFEGVTEPEYFQFWLADEVFERSDSLSLFTINELPLLPVELDSFQVIEAPLPDGRPGRIIYTRFIPQIDSDDRDSVLFNLGDRKPQTMLLAYGTSAEGINFVLWLLDIVFVVTTLTVVIFIRMFVRKSVDDGLSPLIKFNHSISNLSIKDSAAEVQLHETVQELKPMVDSLNQFIVENRLLYLREKRLTSDIAHELKTPIAELISLSEVMLRFPDNNELEKDFGPEVLRISKRLKTIVSNLLLLHKHANTKLEKADVFDINQVIERLLPADCQSRSQLQYDESMPSIVSNLFAVELILSNLINNAFTHSPEGSMVVIETALNNAGQVLIQIMNECSSLQQGDLPQLFEPLWQKDTSRTSDENFGLGLSIAKTLAEAIDAPLEASLQQGKVTFQLLLDV